MIQANTTLILIYICTHTAHIQMHMSEQINAFGISTTQRSPAFEKVVLREAVKCI